MTGRRRRWHRPGTCGRVLTSLVASMSATVLVGMMGTASASSVRGAPVEVLTAPVKVIRTSDGRVGYRSVGEGSPIVLLMGQGLSIDSWAPRFVDELARKHRVLMMDNAGVGRTSAVAWTIPAMADQVAAFIKALDLNRPAVLGLSMGGFVAQALAIDHPGSLGKLVLAATAPGNGHACNPSPSALRAAERSNISRFLQIHFPPNRVVAAEAYAAGVERYPHFYVASVFVADEQLVAAHQWFFGADRVGHEDGAIRVPTLIADGAEDVQLPVCNDRLLTKLIKGSRLYVYPDAGHFFLFQDSAAFVGRVDRFLRAPDRSRPHVGSSATWSQGHVALARHGYKQDESFPHAPQLLESAR